MKSPEIKGVVINAFYDLINKKNDFQQMYLGYKLSMEKEGSTMNKYPIGLKIEEKKISTASQITKKENYDRIKVEFVNRGKEKFESFLKEIKDENGNKLSDSDIQHILSIITLVLRKTISDLTVRIDEKTKTDIKRIAEKGKYNPSYLSRITHKGGKNRLKKYKTKKNTKKYMKKNVKKNVKKSKRRTI